MDGDGEGVDRDQPGPLLSQVAVADKVAFLRSPSAYPGRPADVAVKETHMSWVFLTDTAVYKLKKPVRLPPLDLSTLEARRGNCWEEVRLNRRLAPDTYLGVVPLVRADGRLKLGGEGDVVDWLVEMRRLPEGRMLDRLLETGRLERADVEALATTLAAFYRRTERATLSPEAYAERYRREQARNREVLQARSFALEGVALGSTLDALEEAIERGRGLLMERARSGHVLDGHGDLRPEHVCLVTPVVIFDCLEFSQELRSVDPYDELSFLSLECAALGHGEVGEAVVDRVALRIGQRPSQPLMRLYRAFRATLRARLALAHLLDAVPREPDKWEPMASNYLRAAAAALGEQAG
jgi:aminoglycoside phosphotransferase family enzyme